MSTDDIWKYIDYENKILNRDAIMRIWKSGTFWNPKVDTNDLLLLANMSEEGRLLVREFLEWNYKRMLKERPDSFFTKWSKKGVDQARKKGIDPFDDFYRVSEKTKEGNSFMRLLASFLRAFV